MMYMEPREKKEIGLMKGVTWFSIAPLLGVPLLVLSCSSNSSNSSDGGGGGGSPACTALTGYTPSTTTPLSFATDIYPILSNMMSCGTGGSCHGNPPMYLNTAMTKTLPFGDPPAMVLSELMGPSFNDPSMNIVVPKNVGESFIAYKISGPDALGCVASNCKKGTSVGVTTACGDGMPPPGYTAIAPSDRTKILDWIAQGAAQ